jgi:hypothetical protein
MKRKRVLQQIEIDERYSIKEYEDTSMPEGDSFRHYWAPVINGRECSRVYPTLRSALIGMVCVDVEGIGTHADKYVCRMLGMSEAKTWG